MTDILPEPITVYLGEKGSEKTFSSLTSILKWVEDERFFWAWLSETNPSITGEYAPLKNEIKSDVIGCIDRIQTRITQYNQSPEISTDTIKSEFNLYRQNKVIYSKSKAGKYVEILKKRSEPRAILALYGLSGKAKEKLTNLFNRHHNTVTVPMLISAEIEAAIYFADLKSTGTALEKKLSDIGTELQDKINAYELVHAKYIKDIEEQQKQYKAFEESASQQYQDAIDAFNIEMRRLELEYEEKVRLSAPSKYWTKISNLHGEKVTIFSWVFTILFLLFIGGVAFGGYTIFDYYSTLSYLPDSLKESPDLIKNYKELSQPPHWVIGAVALIVIMCVWFLRIVMKILLSYMHRKSDAESRRVMMQTYLALNKRNKRGESDMDKEQRDIILGALFRPSSDGLVKDDALPIGVLDLLTKHR